MKKYRAVILLLCLVLAMGGCASKDMATEKTVLPAPVPAQAPRNDSRQDVERTALLYLPSVDGDKLVTVPVEAGFSVSRHPAEKLCRLLLEHPGNEYALSLPREATLSDVHPVEVSGNTATVILAAGALRLSQEEVLVVSQALANTLGQLEDVQYVNVLINGVQPGLDLAATQPAGCYQPVAQMEMSAQRNRAVSGKNTSRQTISTALYYPLAGARGIVCEARPLSFDSLAYADVLKTLLSALAEGPQVLQGIPGYPDFFSYLIEEPLVAEENGTKYVALHFDAALNEAIIEHGITRSVMSASLVYTFTTFIPGVEGVKIRIGEERIGSLTPAATLSGAGETIVFEDELMRRDDFSGFLLSGCTLHFSGTDGKLHRVIRMVPYYESRNVRFLVGQLMQGSQDYDSAENLLPVLPQGIRDADLLGVAMEEDTLVLHFSDHLAALSQGMDERQERNMIYAMVNTLCELPGVKKVRFMINDRQPDTLAGALYLPGSFLPSRDILSDE